MLLWRRGRLEPVSQEMQLVAEVTQLTQGEEQAWHSLVARKVVSGQVSTQVPLWRYLRVAEVSQAVQTVALVEQSVQGEVQAVQTGVLRSLLK